MYREVAKLIIYGNHEDTILIKMSDIFKKFDRDEETPDKLISDIYEQIKRSEQAVMDDDSLTTVEKIKAILIAMPDSYSELDWRQIYQLEKSYPRIFARVRVMMEQQWDNTIELLRRGIDEGVIRDIPIPVIKTMFEATLEKYMETTVLIDAGLTFDEAVQYTLDVLMDGISCKEQKLL